MIRGVPKKIKNEETEKDLNEKNYPTTKEGMNEFYLGEVNQEYKSIYHLIEIFRRK